MEQFLPLALLIAIFYFLLIRPQQRRVKQHQQLMSSVGVGDEVVTVGGIFGMVREIDDSEMMLEVSPGTVVRFARSAVSRRVSPEPEEPEPTDEDEESNET